MRLIHGLLSFLIILAMEVNILKILLDFIFNIKKINYMKTKLYYILALFALPFVSFGSIAISGTALSTSASGISVGDYSVLLFDTSGSAFNTAALAELEAGVDLSSSGTYAGFVVADTTPVADFFGFGAYNEWNFSYNLGDIAENDYFGVLTFEGGSSTAVADTTYEIWTSSDWRSPADGAAVTFGAEFTTLGGAAGATGTVVPEPSTYATLAGLFALVFVMLRRRG